MTDRKTERYKAEHTDSGSKEAAGRRIRMVALDLDGTTLNDDKQISERTVGSYCGFHRQNLRLSSAAAFFHRGIGICRDVKRRSYYGNRGQKADL